MKTILDTRKNIITAQESKPIITITQDALIAAYLMTKESFPLKASQFCDMCLKGEMADGTDVFNIERVKHIIKVLVDYGKIKPKSKKKKANVDDYSLPAFNDNPALQEMAKEILNGRGLISLILPSTLNYEKKNSAHPTEHTVKIHQGVFIEGAFDKNTLGSAHGSLIQILNKEYGYEIASNFIDNMQFFGNNWLLIHGFSVGLEDCMITSEKNVLAIKDTLTQYYTKAQGIEETTQNPGIREVRVTAALSQAKDIGMRIAKEAMDPSNNFLTTVISGAKGDFFNIAQLTGLLGQQNLEGHRVLPRLSNEQRTLAHYPFKGLDKEREYQSRGFVSHSFIRGLDPEEFFFHAMSGREGVADKRCQQQQTAKTVLSASHSVLLN